MEWLAVVKEALALLGTVSVFVIPWLGRKLSARAEQVQAAEDTAAQIAEGLKYVESAVAANKPANGPGSAVTRTIQQYGPSAVAAVDTARSLAHQIGEEAWKAREEEIIAREREERRQELAARAAAQ